MTAFRFVVGGPLGEVVEEVYRQFGTNPLYNGISTMIVVALAVVVVTLRRTDPTAGRKIPVEPTQGPPLT